MRRIRGVLVWLWCIPLLGLAASRQANGQGRTARINGEDLYYEVQGEGTPLVLIHGWSLNLRMWDRQVPALSRRFKVIRYDRRGFGKSSGSEDGSWDAADLNALLDHLGLRAAHILGVSQGGRVALQFARIYPDRVLSLTLHGTSAPTGLGLPWTGADRPRFDDWAKLAREQGLDAFRRAWAAHPLMEVPADRPEARSQLAGLLAAYRGGRFLNPTQPSGPIGVDTMDDLLRISVPALVIVGDREVPFLQLVARAFAYYIPNARLAVVLGGGHMVNLIEPGRYNATVLKFLTEVEQSRVHPSR
jgi:3-oxoadipate enol-lactonase